MGTSYVRPEGGHRVDEVVWTAEESESMSAPTGPRWRRSSRPASARPSWAS